MERSGLVNGTWNLMERKIPIWSLQY